MKNRAIRLVLAGGFALLATAPLTSSANAMKCIDEIHAACAALGVVCQHVPEGGKYDLHGLLCESLA